MNLILEIFKLSAASFEIYASLLHELRLFKEH